MACNSFHGSMDNGIRMEPLFSAFCDIHTLHPCNELVQRRLAREHPREIVFPSPPGMSLPIAFASADPCLHLADLFFDVQIWELAHSPK